MLHHEVDNASSSQSPARLNTSVAVRIEQLSHSYPATRRETEPRRALQNIQFNINAGEIFCILGPNGSGKSTLFKILSTLIVPTSGSVSILDFNLQNQREEIRRRIGVVFQHPSLDKKLTAAENLLHQGHLYNVRGTTLTSAIREMLTKVGILDRSDDLVENLSGGMQRRVELAKSLLHHPQLLILDEPSTGLDPGARKEFGEYLQNLRTKEGVTILLTTHILDEADRCDRIAIMDEGKLVALGTPHDLKHAIGGDVISVASINPTALCSAIKATFGGTPTVVGTCVRIERTKGHEFIPQLVQSFPGQIDAITLSKPTLEDVFIGKTGHTFWSAAE